MGSQCCKCSDGKKQQITDYNSENINIRFHGKNELSRIRYRIETYGNAPNSRSKLSQSQNIFYHPPIDQNLTDNYRLPDNARKEHYWRDQMNIQNISIEPQEGEPPIFIRRFTDLAAKVGTRIRFLVEIESSPSPKVTWHRGHKEVDVVESRFSLVHEGNFYCIDIAQVRIDDEGYWTCLAENIHGRSSCTSCLSLIIPKAYKKPHFVEELRALLTETGTVSLECKVVGIPTPILKWFKDDKEIKAGDVFALTAAPDDKTSLGIYTCEATNCMGTAHSSSKIHVIDRDSGELCRKSSGSLPVFEKILKDKSCKIGDDMSLSCQIVVPPWPKDVTWYNKTGRIRPNEKYNVREDGLGMYSIEIKAVEAVDGGEWKCVATSLENAKQFTTCYISMIIPKNYRIPRFMEGLKAVLTEEGLVSFECKVVGFPTPVLKWFKDGQELKPGDVYQLTGRNSLGLYCCIATNCMGEAKSTAQLTIEDIEQQLNEEERLQLSKESSQVPKFIRGLQSCEAIINENFKFTTQLNLLSSPEPSVSWYRNDQHIIENDKYKLIKESLDTFHIEIKKLELIDQAEWKCVAENDFGHSVTSCFLKLIIPSHFKKPKYLENLRAVFSKEGTVNLECKVIGVPQPVLKWYKDGLELKPGDIHRIISGENGTCCLGIYTCEATNCMGSVSSSASLLGFEDNANKEPPKENQSLEELARNLSLSTIHEERTSQLYDTPQTEHSLSLDDRGEVSFSFDGKEVSVSLYETPDLTEEDAIQIIEMYADQLSEHINESNIVELPPMRFVKETSTSGNLLMEAIVIDISPDYFIANEYVDDLCTEVDVEDVSIMDDQTQSIMSSYSSAVGEKAPQKPLRKKQSENGSSKSEHSEKNQQKSTPTLDLSESYYSAKEVSSIRDNSADHLSSSIHTNNVSLINNEQKMNVNRVVEEKEPARHILSSTSNDNLNYSPESLSAIEKNMAEDETSEILNYPKYSQIIEEELSTVEESVLYRSPKLVENASIILSNIHFALSSALEKVSTSSVSNNNQSQNEVIGDINPSVCNLLSEIENMRQCVGDLTITFADPLFTSTSISEYTSNPVSDKFINLKVPLQYIKGMISSQKHNKEFQYIFNSVASPMENLREAIINLSEEIYIEPEVLELLDDVTENIFSITTAEFYPETHAVGNLNENRSTGMCEPSTREISAIMIGWLDSLDTWLRLTSIEKIYPESKRSNLISIINCVKKELFNITASNHHSKAASQILVLSQQLSNLKDSLEHILDTIIQHRDEIGIAIIDELTIPIEHMFEASREISSINETDDSLIKIIEDLKNEIASRVCMIKQDELQHMEKLLAYEFPIDESFTALNKINIVPFNESDSESLISELSNPKIIDSEKYTSTTLENKIDNEEINVLSKAEDEKTPQMDIKLKQRKESEIVSNLKRSEQLNAWTLTIIEPLNHMANTGLSLDRSIEEQVHTLLCKPLHSLHKQIDLMASQMNRNSPGQSLENDVETIIEGFLWPVNQLQNAIELATNVWRETPPNVQVRKNLTEFAHSTSDLCEQLISLRKELIRGAPESSLQIQKADASLIETITAVLGPLQNIQNVITVTLDNLIVEKYEENNTMLITTGQLENMENNNRDSNCENIMEAHTTPTNNELNLVEESEDIQSQVKSQVEEANIGSITIATSEKGELLNPSPESITEIHTPHTNREFNSLEDFEGIQNQFGSPVQKTDISNITTTTSEEGELLNLGPENIMETHTIPTISELKSVEEFEHIQNQFESQLEKADIPGIIAATSEKGEILNLSHENIMETHTTPTNRELNLVEEFEHIQNQFESQVEKADISGIIAATSEEGEILNLSHENIMETHTIPTNSELKSVEEFEHTQNQFESQVKEGDTLGSIAATSEKGEILKLSHENIMETHTTPINRELNLVAEFEGIQNQFESQVQKADISSITITTSEKGELLNLGPENIIETHTIPKNSELKSVEEFEHTQNQFESQVKEGDTLGSIAVASEKGEILKLNHENTMETHTILTNSELKSVGEFENTQNQFESQVEEGDTLRSIAATSEEGEILKLSHEKILETHTTPINRELNLVAEFEGIQNQFESQVQKADISNITITTSEEGELLNLSSENILEIHTTPTNSELKLVEEFEYTRNQLESQVKKVDIPMITAATSEEGEILNLNSENITEAHTSPTNKELNSVEEFEDIPNQFETQVKQADISNITTTMSEKGESFNLSPVNILETHTTPANSDLKLVEDFEDTQNQLESQIKEADIPGITPPTSEKGEILNLSDENMVETHTTATNKELNLVEGFEDIQDQFQSEVQKANISSLTTTTSEKGELSNLSPENILGTQTTVINNELNLVGEFKNIQNQSESQVKNADIIEITTATSEREEPLNLSPESIIKTNTTPRNTELNLVEAFEDINHQLETQVQNTDIPSTATTKSEKGEILNLSPENMSTLDLTSGKSNDNFTESLKKKALSTVIYSSDEDSEYKKSYDSEIVHDSSLVSMGRVGDEPPHEKLVLLEKNIVDIIKDELHRQSALELASISLLECIKEKVGHIIAIDSNMNEQSIFEEMVRDITVEELQKFKWANENTDEVMRNEPLPTISLVDPSKTNLECDILNQQNILESGSSENKIKSDMSESSEVVKSINVSNNEDFPENEQLDDILLEPTNREEEMEENMKKWITAQLEGAIIKLIDARKLTNTVKCQLKKDTSFIFTEPISDEKIELLITAEIEGYKKNFFKADKNISYESDLTKMSIEDSIKRLIMMDVEQTLPILLNRESNTRTIKDDVQKIIKDYSESLPRKFSEGMIRELVTTVFETKRAELLKTTNTELKEVLAKQVSTDNTIEHEIEVLVISELGNTFANMIDIEEYKEVIKSRYQETIFNYPSISEHLISDENIEEIITMELEKQKVDIIEFHDHDEKNIRATQACIDITAEEVIKSLVTSELENSFAKMIEEKRYTDPIKFNVQLTLLNNSKFTQEHVSEEHIGELIITELEKHKLKVIEPEADVSLEKPVARKEPNNYKTPMILKSPKNIELAIPWEFSNENNAGEQGESQQSTIVIVNDNFQSASICDDLILLCPQFLDEQVADEPIERIESDNQAYSTETVNVHLVEDDKYEVKAEPPQLILVKAKLLDEHFIDEGIESMRSNELQQYNIQTVNVNLVDDNEQRIEASQLTVVTPAAHSSYMEDIVDNEKYTGEQIQEKPMMMSEKTEESETSKIGLGSDTEFGQGDDILNVAILTGDPPIEHENAGKLITKETNKMDSKSMDNNEMNQASTDVIHSFNPSQNTEVEFYSQDESPIVEEKPINVDTKQSIFLHAISNESIRDIVRTEIHNTTSETSLDESDMDAITRDIYGKIQTIPEELSLSNVKGWAKEMVVRKLHEMNMEKEKMQGKPKECTQRSRKSKKEIPTAEDDTKPETITKEERIDEEQNEISRKKQEETIYTKENTELVGKTVKQRKGEKLCDEERRKVEEICDEEEEGRHSLDTETLSRVKVTTLKDDGAVNSDMEGMIPKRTMMLDNFEEEKDKQSKESRTKSLDEEQNSLKEKDISFGKNLNEMHPKNEEMDLIEERDDIRLEKIKTECSSSGKFANELLDEVKQELVIDESLTNVNVTEDQYIKYKKKLSDSELKNDDAGEYREKYRRGVDENQPDRVLSEKEHDLSLDYSHHSEAEENIRIGMELHESEKLSWNKEAHVRSGSTDNDSLISTDSPLSPKCNVKFLNANERDVSTHLPSISIGCDESFASDQSRYSDPLYTSSRIYHQSDNEGVPSSFDYSSTVRLASSGPRDNAKKPIFCMKLTNRTAITASRIKLTCTVLGEPEPHITWLKNNKELEELSNRYCITNDNGIISLEIYSLRIEDSGEYSCVAKNIHGRACTEAKLKVYAGYESTPSVPIFTRSIRDKFKMTEDKLILECKVKAQPSPIIRWLKDDRVLIMGNKYKQSDLPDGICRLEISNPCGNDNGTYICRAENESGFSDSTSHIIDCGSKDENYRERSTTSCRSGSINYDGTNTERFTNKPYFSSYLTNHTVTAGGTIGLQVQIESASIPEVTWLRHDTRTPIFLPKAQSFADHNIYTLVLPNASESESGTYICRASNAHGYVDSAARVEIVSRNLGDNGKPAIFLSRPVDKLIHAYTGEDVSLSFRTTGVPKPRVILMKGLTDITNGARAYKESHDDYVRITFKRVQISDEGTYCILVKNRYGCDRSFFTLRIKQRARSLTPSVEWSTENMENFLSYMQDANQLSYTKRVPGAISSKPLVIDGGKSWLALTWGKAESRGTAPVTAYRVDAWLLGGDGGARWVELGITSTNSFDAFNLRPGGEYKFRVTPRNRYGWGESVTMENSVRIEEIIAFPEFTKILPGQLKVLKGTMLHLSCEISSDSAAHIRWYKDSAEIYISEDPRLITNRSGSKCTLSIRDVEENDSGRYVCDATNSAGRVSTFARVQVVTDPKIVEADMKFRKMRFSDGLNDDRPPEFTMRLRDRRVQTTFPVRLTCQVSGYPEPEVTWYKYEQKINLQVENITISKDEAHFHTLEINRAKIDDTGIYMASAKNLYGCVSCRCHLVVDEGIRAYIAPEFSQHLNEVYIVNQNAELRMNAQVKAYPAVGINWYRDGKHLRPGRNTVMSLNHDGTIELTLAHMTNRDAGLYCCVAINEVGRAESITKVQISASYEDINSTLDSSTETSESSAMPYSKAPVFIKKPLSTEAFEGDNIIIMCEVIGDPKPEVIWLRDFLRPDYYKDSPLFRRIGLGPQYRLEIPYAKLDFTGTYSVIAKNSYGEAKAVISLQIYARDPDEQKTDIRPNVKHGEIQTIPILKNSLKDIRCCDGDAITFSCKIYAIPSPNIRWERAGKLVALGGDITTEFDGEVARLHIEHVYPEDEGEYACIAYNSLGNIHTSACLIVDVPEGKEISLNRRLKKPTSLLSLSATPISTPRLTPVRSLSPSCLKHELRLTVEGLYGQKRGRRAKIPTTPKFYAVPHNRVVEEGDTVRFQCAVAGHPMPWAHWDKDGIAVMSNARISIIEKNDLRILEIVEIIYDDAGLYRITLENEIGRVEATARLEVIRGRYSMISRGTIKQSSSEIHPVYHPPCQQYSSSSICTPHSSILDEEYIRERALSPTFLHKPSHYRSVNF